VNNGPETDNDKASRRILARVAQEADSGSASLLASSSRKFRDHVSAVDADRADPIEIWGTRIGRTLGLAISVVILIMLVIWIVRGG
jgi:hypothetical protein